MMGAGERDIMNLPTKDLSSKELGLIRIFVLDAVGKGHMTRGEGISRLKRFGISIPKGLNKGGSVAKTKSVRYSKGGYSKPHNYFAGGSVANNLKSR